MATPDVHELALILQQRFPLGRSSQPVTRGAIAATVSLAHATATWGNVTGATWLRYTWAIGTSAMNALAFFFLSNHQQDMLPTVPSPYRYRVIRSLQDLWYKMEASVDEGMLTRNQITGETEGLITDTEISIRTAQLAFAEYIYQLIAVEHAYTIIASLYSGLRLSTDKKNITLNVIFNRLSTEALVKLLDELEDKQSIHAILLATAIVNKLTHVEGYCLPPAMQAIHPEDVALLLLVATHYESSVDSVTFDDTLYTSPQRSGADLDGGVGSSAASLAEPTESPVLTPTIQPSQCKALQCLLLLINTDTLVAAITLLTDMPDQSHEKVFTVISRCYAALAMPVQRLYPGDEETQLSTTARKQCKHLMQNCDIHLTLQALGMLIFGDDNDPKLVAVLINQLLIAHPHRAHEYIRSLPDSIILEFLPHFSSRFPNGESQIHWILQHRFVAILNGVTNTEEYDDEPRAVSSPSRHRAMSTTGLLPGMFAIFIDACTAENSGYEVLRMMLIYIHSKHNRQLNKICEQIRMNLALRPRDFARVIDALNDAHLVRFQLINTEGNSTLPPENYLTELHNINPALAKTLGHQAPNRVARLPNTPINKVAARATKLILSAANASIEMGTSELERELKSLHRMLPSNDYKNIIATIRSSSNITAVGLSNLNQTIATLFPGEYEETTASSDMEELSTANIDTAKAIAIIIITQLTEESDNIHSFRSVLNRFGFLRGGGALPAHILLSILISYGINEVAMHAGIITDTEQPWPILVKRWALNLMQTFGVGALGLLLGRPTTTRTDMALLEEQAACIVAYFALPEDDTPRFIAPRIVDIDVNYPTMQHALLLVLADPSTANLANVLAGTHGITDDLTIFAMALIRSSIDVSPSYEVRAANLAITARLQELTPQQFAQLILRHLPACENEPTNISHVSVTNTAAGLLFNGTSIALTTIFDALVDEYQHAQAQEQAGFISHLKNIVFVLLITKKHRCTRQYAALLSEHLLDPLHEMAPNFIPSIARSLPNEYKATLTRRFRGQSLATYLDDGFFDVELDPISADDESISAMSSTCEERICGNTDLVASAFDTDSYSYSS